MVEFETATSGSALAAVDPGAEFLTRLRAETRVLHAATERHLAPAERLQDVHGYVRLLRTLYPLYASVEARLLSFDAFAALDPSLDVLARRRAHLLLADLRALGVDADPRGDMRDAAAPGLGHFAHALGALYVLEGSRLGGRLLARRVAANIGGATLGALSFLRSDGSDVGPLWTGYCACTARLRGARRRAQPGRCHRRRAGHVRAVRSRARSGGRRERAGADRARPAAALSRCDREPIHVPGAVQGHGGLLAIDRADGRIAFCSDNVAALLGLAADPLGANIEEVLGAGSMERFAGAVDVASLEEIPKMMVLGTGRAMAFTTHRSDDLVVVEMEAPDAPDARDALLHEVRRAVQRVEATDDAAAACAAAVDEVRRITGYDRVMVYRFHEDEHGEVVAEARRPDIEPFLGLHYPATDIPRPARRLLRLSPTRMIGDVDGTPVPIAGHGAFAGRQLDLSRSVLRAVSPIHLQYLRNMGVAASLTISLTDGPRLWGLLACHHDEPRVASPELRSACAIVARTLWQRVDGCERLRRAPAGRAAPVVARTIPGRPSRASTRSRRRWWPTAGSCSIWSVRTASASASTASRRPSARSPAREHLSTLVGQLSRLEAEPPIVTDEIGALGPEAWAGSHGVAGLVAAPISAGWDEYVIWFRGEAVRTVTWAGDPRKPVQEAPAAGAATSARAPRSRPGARRCGAGRRPGPAPTPPPPPTSSRRSPTSVPPVSATRWRSARCATA